MSKEFVLYSAVQFLTNLVSSLREEESDGRVRDFEIYWSPTGLLVLAKNHDCSYFMHNNQVVFVLNPSMTMKVGITRIDGKTPEWKHLIFDMINGVAVRSLTKKDEVPKCGRLVRMVEDLVPTVEALVKNGDVQWIAP
jgi:hypothetical protein